MSRRMIRWTRSDAENGMRADSCPSDKPEGGGGRGEGKKRPRDEFRPGTESRKGGEGVVVEKVEGIRSNSWNRGGGWGLPSYLCIKDANRYLSILPFQGALLLRVSWLQPKLKLHFTMVFQVVAELSRNFNIPRRERLKIQTATCHSIATFHAIPTPSEEVSSLFYPSCFHLEPLSRVHTCSLSPP